MYSDRYNHNIVDVLYQQNLNKKADKIAYFCYVNLLRRDNSLYMINKIRQIIVLANSRKVYPYELSEFPDKELALKLQEKLRPKHEYTKKKFDTESPPVESIPIETKPVQIKQYAPRPVKIVQSKNHIRFLSDYSIETKGKGLEIMKRKSFLIIGLIKNIVPHIENLKRTISDIFSISPDSRFFFLTNNNSDHTVTILQEWMREETRVDGVLYQNLPVITLNPNGTIGNRTQILAKLRNENFRLATQEFGKDFDYLMVMDTDLEQPLDYNAIASSFELEEWDLIAGNSVFANTRYHYDVFALRLFDQPYDVNILYPKFKKYYGHSYRWIDDLYIFNTFYKVKAAFGGVCLINKKAFDHDSLWDESGSVDLCEHLSLCSKFSNIYINPKISTSIGMQKNLQQGFPSELSDSIFCAPFMFIPRDAGFFSVFNFLVGSLSRGIKLYPYFKKEMILKLDQKIEHFCYLNTNIDNSWFEFFQPMQYYNGDETHICGNFKDCQINRGEFAENEFRFPNKTRELYNLPYFKKWRERVHGIFKNYIKLNPKIIQLSDKISVNFAEKMIGVHFRHPSHSCEQGIVYLNNYYHEIDEILAEHPDAKIYLATDTDFGIAAFLLKYPNIVIWNKNCSRSSMDNILQWAYQSQKHKMNEVGFLNGIGYELHYEKCRNEKYSTELGVEVLLDVNLLAKCNWLIHTISNLSLAVSYWNPLCKMLLIDGIKS